MPSLLGGAMRPYLIQMGVWCALATDVQPRERKTGRAWRDDRESSDTSTRRRFRTPLDKGPVNGCLWRLVESTHSTLPPLPGHVRTVEAPGRPKPLIPPSMSELNSANASLRPFARARQVRSAHVFGP